jgi:hypothetical protein
MVKIYELDGYKYSENNPHLEGMHQLGGDSVFNENLFYMCFSSTDWEKAQRMMRFIIENHVPWLEEADGVSFFNEFLQPYVKENRLLKVHLVISQHPNVNDGQVAVMASKRKPKNISQNIAKKKEFYANR